MHKLSFSLILILTFSANQAQTSPHGDTFKIECDKCHTSDSWEVNLSGIQFDHSMTKFPLEGEHAIVPCKSCHKSLIFSNGDSRKRCVDCHKDIHANSVGNNCIRCHTPKSWIIENISDLHRTGRFPLIGSHTKADCNQCHKSVSDFKFETLGIRCNDCHQQDFITTQNPNHVKSGFSIECQKCHLVSSLSWTTNTVNHDFFPLIGGHSISNCFACHSQNTFVGLPLDCYSCHKTNYASAINHVAQSYPTDCKICHSINNWTSSIFNHATTGFPLTGFHAKVTCAGCHPNGLVSGTISTVCSSCHITDYNNTSNPNHAAANFTTACEQCHNTTAWSPSTFNHDTQYFPIYSGTHKSAWTLCSDCHSNSANFAVFTCIQCHQHNNQTSVASNHNGVRNFSYTPTSCYSCHPAGRSGG